MPTPNALSALELKIPPPAVGVVVGLLMWLASRLTPVVGFAVPGRTPFAICLAVIGLIVAALGVRMFRGVDTTLNPTKPAAASSLVVAGIFRFTRNPMYLGLLLMLLGGATYLSNALAFLFIPVFVAYMNRFQIAPEERALTQIFGAEYTSYRARVRRWI